ncbi:MAG TPA: Rne/Rng family ribonuclease, partial [Edaphobacter sp.]|nr:Rne/Rng family ribonuclease [Edaphobacter sp.]
IVENDALAEIYYERENEYTLAGSIYNGKVTRVLPGMQSSFVDIGLERDAFLYITDFMEEAGDSADFDTNGDSSRRRNGNAPIIEGAVANPDQTTDSANRGDRGGDRNGRGDRNRGRGRRDRGGNRDRQPLSDSPAPSETQEAQDFSRDDFSAPAEFSADNAETARTDEPSFGEGAPGADGSRRWRGRRGRRRGRGPGQRDESPQTASAQPISPSLDSAYEGPTSDSQYDDSFDIDGAEAAPPRIDTAPIASAYPSDTTGLARENTGRNDRNDRGDRNRGGRDRNDRNRGRGDRGGRDSRVPRGFAPRTSLYGVEDTPGYNESAESANAVEPIVLPGESLSKYRKDSEAPTAAAPKATEANIIIPSAPEYTIPAGWDGGATLPGESLSRHRRSENSSANSAENFRGDFSDRRSPYRQDIRVEHTNSEPGGETIQKSQAVTAAENTEQQHELSAASRESTSAMDMQPEPSTPAFPVEYEPTDASASYRVDPAAPSEFRQSAPVLEFPAVEAEAREAVAEEVLEAEAPASHAPEDVAEAHGQSYTSSSNEAVAQLHTEPTHEHTSAALERFDWQTPPAPVAPAPAPAIAAEAAHDVTTLHATGDLTSEAPSPTFIPSAGAFIEETLDEEDYNTTLHASSIEEMDDDFEEEETLEGAADLGTMIREMSIDQITRAGNVDEEEELEDFEEEDSIHDPTIEDFNDVEEVEGEDNEEDLDESDTEEDVLHEEFTEGGEAGPSNGFDQAQAGNVVPARDRDRSSDRGRGRRDGRRDGRRFGRSDRGDRPRHAGGAADRERSGGGRDRRGGRSSMQSTNLPAISELLKPGQEILVQIAKEPIAKKGARITSHIALPGRFLVFMPTVNHTGVSRKIDSDSERRRLKEILLSEKGEATGGFIVRTAAEGASEEELRSDLRFLLNLWADIKQRSESSKSPALIYHDLNLVERILRDQVTDNFSAIWVDTEADYERILRFLQRFQPSLIRRVKLYTKETPLFEQFGITEEINKALRSKVWLKSGGSIVINQTEALVAIDINTGKFVGKTARLEDTIVKTNLDAIPEIVRQIRLRDLGGIIIIDFIDMDERKNRNRVMAALEEELKNDRAPSKILQFNDFGLVAITRKRVKQSLERTLSTTCNICTGTGMVKSPVTVCNDIYIEMRKMQRHLERGDVMLRVNPEVVKQLKAPGTKWLQEMEEMVGKTILVKSDPSLHPEQFDIH